MEYVIDFITLMHDFNNQNPNAYLQLLDFLPQDLSDDIYKGVFLFSILFQFFFHIYFIGKSDVFKSKLLNIISAAIVTAIFYELSHVIMIGTMSVLVPYVHGRNMIERFRVES